MGGWSIAVTALAVVSACALGAQILSARARGRSPLFAAAAGSSRRGAAYAFGPGMSPAAKESAREHLPAWFAGMAYHGAILTAFISLVLVMAGVTLTGAPLAAIRLLTLLGSLGGLGLLLRRALGSTLRGLSRPDDFVANLLTTGFVGLAFLRTFWPALETVFLIETMVLLLYIPLGKIRHCLFFFPTRYHSGSFFGRRGTYPPRHGRAARRDA